MQVYLTERSSNLDDVIFNVFERNIFLFFHVISVWLILESVTWIAHISNATRAHFIAHNFAEILIILKSIFELDFIAIPSIVMCGDCQIYSRMITQKFNIYSTESY